MSRDHFNYGTSIHGTLWPEEQFVENKNQCSILLFFYEASYCTSSKLIYNFGYNKRLFLSMGLWANWPLRHVILFWFLSIDNDDSSSMVNI